MRFLVVEHIDTELNAQQTMTEADPMTTHLCYNLLALHLEYTLVQVKIRKSTASLMNYCLSQLTLILLLTCSWPCYLQFRNTAEEESSRRSDMLIAKSK